MAQGDITGIEILETFSTKSNPFWSQDSLPFSGKYFGLNNFKSLNTNKRFQNTVLGTWTPTRDKAEFTFPYNNIFELILHSGTQSGTIGENSFASTGDLINAGFSSELANRYGYKYTATGANIGYNEIYIEGTGNTIYDLLGKEVQCIMISRFSDSGIVPFDNLSGFKAKKQKALPGLMRYQFFLTTGSFLSGNGVNQKYSYLSVGTKVNTENYLNVTGNNQNLFMRHSGISGENLFGTFDISNSGNYRLNYNVVSLDPKITIDETSPTGFAVRAGNVNRMPKRKRFFNKKNISYSINTSGLILNQEYTGHIRVSGIYRNDAIYNITGVSIPITYKISDHGARAAFDNFYFRYTGDFHQNINGFQVYPNGNIISLNSGVSGYPKLTLGLTIYNTGTGVYSSVTLNRISSGFYKPKIESKLFWEATGDSNNIKILNKNGSVYFGTGISGSLPTGKYIIHSGQSGAFQNDIFFSIYNTGQISTGIFSGNLLVNVSDSSNQNRSFPISINFL
jgi:hypothetical protein